MTVLLIEAAATGLTVQDEGRTGLLRYGIPVAGAMDRTSLAAANALVGNPPGTCGLEMTLAGFRLRVSGGPVLLAAFGPGVGLSLGDRTIPAGQSGVAEDGTVVSVSRPRDGVYGYLAVSGGFDIPPEMGSNSTHLRTGLGPAPIKAGDVLPVRESGVPMVALALAPLPLHGTGPIRTMAGPQEDWFTPEAMDRLTAELWIIDARSDRMGMFLRGATIEAAAGSMVSDGTLPGSIQVSPAGSPIVLMRDAQTTGGYPKIATVITADLDRLSQIPPGGTLRFQIVTRAEAVAALRSYRQLIAGLRPKPAIRIPDTETLLRLNLIDGVWG
jgi:biotin-dependent carboxylase-like uncharacterized protein